ncbi:hypothetical protein [Vulcanococcus sp.]|jgi:hypothetical protein
MSLWHCPLCIGLGLLSLVRAGAHLTLLSQLVPGKLAAPLLQA